MVSAEVQAEGVALGNGGWSELDQRPAHLWRQDLAGSCSVPHLFGSYGPRHDALARGAFVGLTGATTRTAMGRAVLEGLSFQTRASLDALSRRATFSRDG